MIDVIIAGGGPTGLMLAGELRLHGVQRGRAGEGGGADQGRPRARPARAQHRGDGPARPAGAVPRARPAAPGRRLLRRHRQAARRTGWTPRTRTSSASRSPITDRLLAEHATEVGAEIRRGSELVGLSQDDDGVTVELADGTRLRARYLVGCDGGRSTVRKLLGVGFPGEPSRVETLLGEMEVTAPPEDGGRGGGRGPQDPAAVRRRPARRTGCTASSCPPRGWPRTARSRRPSRSSSSSCGRSPAPTSACTRRAGCPASATPPGWPSATGSAGCCWPATRRTSTRRPAGRGSTSASRTRSTSAGSWPPQVNGWAPEGLLDSYHTERHPVAADVLDNTRAQMELMSLEPGPQAVRRLLSELMDFEEVNRYLIEKITAIGVRYDFGDGPRTARPAAAGRRAEAGSPLRADARRPRAAARPDRPALGRRAGRTGSTTSSTSARNWTCPRCCCGRTATWRGSVTTRRVCRVAAPVVRDLRRAPGTAKAQPRAARSGLRPAVGDTGIQPVTSRCERPSGHSSYASRSSCSGF